MARLYVAKRRAKPMVNTPERNTLAAFLTLITSKPWRLYCRLKRWRTMVMSFSLRALCTPHNSSLGMLSIFFHASTLDGSALLNCSLLNRYLEYKSLSSWEIHEELWIPLVMLVIGISEMGSSGHKLCHISRLTTPWSLATPLQKAAKRNATIVIQYVAEEGVSLPSAKNSSHESPISRA